jgi:hypothetical protein
MLCLLYCPFPQYELLGNLAFLPHVAEQRNDRHQLQEMEIEDFLSMANDR